MAKKEETPNMVERFAEFKELKNIDKTTMISVLEESFRNVLAKMFGTDENLDVIMNPDKGDVQIFQNLEVVPDGEVANPNLQISLSDARADDDPAIMATPKWKSAKSTLRKSYLPISADAQSSHSGRPCNRKSSNCRKKPYMPSSKTSKGNSSQAKYIRHGRVRPSFSTTIRTNSSCLRTSPSLATSSAKGKQCVR